MYPKVSEIYNYLQFLSYTRSYSWYLWYWDNNGRIYFRFFGHMVSNFQGEIRGISSLIIVIRISIFGLSRELLSSSNSFSYLHITRFPTFSCVLKRDLPAWFGDGEPCTAWHSIWHMWLVQERIRSHGARQEYGFSCEQGNTEVLCSPRILSHVLWNDGSDLFG